MESHLCDCARLGYEIDYRDFVSQEREKLILDAYEKVGGNRLKPIKEALPPEISYTEIKFALCKYNIGEQQEKK